MIKDIDVKYIEIVGTPRTISNKMNVEIQFGQEGNLVGAQNTKIKDSDGSRIFFNSMVDALNFMDKYGYKYLDSYITSANETTTYHYILIKKREEEIVSENYE
ncbi:hypothetical protein [uncultured Salegentibacter sp.]|uniref:hypothetical protein n=1 Tax=uncultured Salegentibacter sp. TaxID=259320 RepID=UPI002597F7C7|nr:hypothetical protein [uncultured Salegentibacter sp.]